MRAFKIIFTLIGIALLIGAVLSFNSTNTFVSKAQLTEGTVTELLPRVSKDSDSGSTSVTYAPVVEFVTDAGQTITYISSSSSNPPSYQPGETMSIYYLPNSPQTAKIDGFADMWLATTIFAILGVVFFLVGFVPVLYAKINANKASFLRERGIAIETNYQGVERNTALVMNGKSPYQIISHWQNPDTTQLHIFKSHNIWFDPSDYITQDKITVYVAPDNYKKYYLDTSFLPQIA